ncbi:MAG: flagellar motor protein MotB [Pseudomonadota bacterium]
MAGDKPIVIVKKKGGHGDHGHHGGAWKVAYADFVTAMMAFFLLLWLLNATSEDKLAGLADYFDPTIPITSVSGGGTGLLQGDERRAVAERAGMTQIAGGARERQHEEGRDEADGKAEGDTDTAGEGEGRGAPAAAGETAGEADAVGGRAGDGTEAGDGLVGEAADQIVERIDAVGDSHLAVRVVADGLVIELVDLVDEPLFASGSATPEPVLGVLAGIVASAIADTVNPIAVIGHTDAAPFRGSGAYSNWELSADRANAARRLLIAAGLDGARFVAVEGRAATEPRTADPLAAENRRIAVKLLTTSR